MGLPMMAMQAAGSAMQAFGQVAGGFRQNSQDQQNAAIAEQNAQTAGLQGGVKQYAAGLRTANEVGTQKVDFAANNVTEGSPSAQNVIAGTRKAGEMNQSALQFTTANQVNDQNYQASSDKAAGSAAEIGGFIGAAGTLMGSAANYQSNQMLMSRFKSGVS